MNQQERDSEARLVPRLLDENEQLRTALENVLEENARLVEERERLSRRVTSLSTELQSVNASFARSNPPEPRRGEAVKSHDAAQAEEELRVAFEELQVLTEELEIANASLVRTNQQLDAQISERTQEVARTKFALLLSEASFRTVADLVPDLLWSADAAGNAVWFNSRWFAQTGQSVEGAMGDGWIEALHPADQAACRAAWRKSIETGAAFEHQHRMRIDNGFHWVLARALAMYDDQGRVQRWFGAMTDIHEQRTALEALGRSELRFRTLVEGMPPLVWRAVDGGHWTWSSPQWSAFTGLASEASLGLGWLEAFHPEDRDAARKAWEEARATGGMRHQGRIFSAHDRGYRHFDTRASAVRDETAGVVEWLGASSDIHELVELRQEQDVLVAELQHRTRNLMAVVQAVMHKTLQGSASLEEFEARIYDRLGALARVQGLLARRNEGARVSFDELLKEELRAHIPEDPDLQSERVSLDGPPGVSLRSATVQTLALAVHELTTNAVKYGALSRPDGRLSVTWSFESTATEPSKLKVFWVETGVPDVPSETAPSRGGGYGLELIRRALPYQLGAKTDFCFAEDGVRCSIELPVPS